MIEGLLPELLGGALVGAVALAIGGLPLVLMGIRELRAQRIALLHVDERITSEVKKRAGAAGVEARQSGRSAAREAEELAAQLERGGGGPRLIGNGR
jgi:hypothetical protein